MIIFRLMQLPVELKKERKKCFCQRQLIFSRKLSLRRKRAKSIRKTNEWMGRNLQMGSTYSNQTSNRNPRDEKFKLSKIIAHRQLMGL